MGLLVIGAFLVLFLLGFPVVLAIALPSVVYVLAKGIPIDLLAQRVHYALDSYPLLAVPIFIFVGNLMNSTGITTRIFRFANAVVGRVAGGLAQVNILASLLFSGMSGAALADVGGLGQIEIDAMKRRGFPAPFAAAVTAASATVGPIFPPSIPLIIYGAVAGVSIVRLLLAGIVPALLAVVVMMVLTAVLATLRGYPRAARWPEWRRTGRDFIVALPALVAPLLLIVGLLAGEFTPTEAAGVTVLYVILIGVFVYRDLSFAHVLHAAQETLLLSSRILIIVAVASLFGWILTVEMIPQMFAKAILGISHNPYVLLLIVNILLLIAGMFLDATTAILLLVPIVTPPLVASGVDPVHLGLVMVFNLMIGLLTPPLGLSLFLVSDIAKVPVHQVLHSAVPYIVVLLATLIFLTYCPQAFLWIPNMMNP